MTAIDDYDDTETASVTISTRTAAPRMPATTESEQRVLTWIEPYSQAWHLVRARDWLVFLNPDASLEARLAVVTHDIERMFPHGPRQNKATGRWDDPHYLYAHASRSAEVVGFWLQSQPDVRDEIALPEVQRLITLHEFGGIGGADLVQAADSLSFLETLQDLARSWVVNGECGVEQARAKHLYMAERIRVPEARRLAEPLLEQALASLEDL
jgi:hypothetical protein